jgi:caffeoyl-CoA O-methyltransferase
MARGPVDLPAKLAAYVAAVGTRETAVQRRLRAVTRKIPMGTMQIGPDQAAMMQVLVRALGAKRCLEIGTFTGYSSLAVALALPPGGKIICCDVSEEWTAIARKYWRIAGVAKKIQLKLAPALQTLKKLKGPFDFAFIDADKENYPRYYEELVIRTRPGGLIVLDNVLRSGRVVDPAAQSPADVAMRMVNDTITADPRVESVMLPLRDGVTLARKL